MYIYLLRTGKYKYNYQIEVIDNKIKYLHLKHKNKMF